MAELMYYTTHEDTTTGVTSQKLKGYKYNRQFLTKVETKVQFPECPAVRSTGINPSMSYSVAEIQNKISSSLFVRSKQNTAEDFVLAQHLKRDESCVAMVSADMITFNSSNTWSSVTYLGTAEVNIDLGAREITCISSGTIFNIKVLNASRDLIEWYPCSESNGSVLYNVLVNGEEGTLSNPTWSTQARIAYNSTYGYAYGKSLSIDHSNQFEAMVTADSSANRLARFRYSDDGILYRVFMEADGSGTGATVNDPNGDSQGFVTIDANEVLNIYMGNSQVDVEMGGSTFMSIDTGFASGRIYVLVDILAGDPFNVIEIQDNTIADNFIEAYQSYFSTTDNPFDYLTIIDELFKGLNGGAATSGANFPNGVDDTYPSTTLGMTGVTSTDLRQLLDAVLTESTSIDFMQALYDDAVYQSTSTGRNALIRRHFGSLNKVLLSGTLYELELNLNNVLATQAGGGGSDGFFSNYERTLQYFDTIVFRTAGNSENNVDQWVQIHQLTVDNTSKEPAKYSGPFEMSTETITVRELENQGETNTVGNFAKRMMAYTDSEL
tara:strand:- start:5638 stop:7293 length:1656 start_codon:yes stop_codon:yes gene_type:complete